MTNFHFGVNFFLNRVIALYNLVVGIVVFGALRLAGRLRKDKVIAILLRRT